MLSIREKVRLIDELIEERPEATLKDYIATVAEIENEVNLIQDSFNYYK